jgi:hypothetical protein
LALLALAVQVMLSFGHVHLCNLAPTSSTSAMLIASGAALPGGGAPGHHPDGSPDADCQICALLQLVAMSAAPVAPALPLPTSFRSIRLQAPAELAASASPHSQFQARAPPAA